MDEYLVYLKNEGCYGRGIIINDHYNVEYFVDGCCYNNNFDNEELDVIRLLEEL